MTIAALYVDEAGVYSDLPGVDLWGLSRDARNYKGPHPVVAHPPCTRWCQLAPVNESRYGHLVGDDGGTFVHALWCVRRFGGVLEHPANTHAWAWYGLTKPSRGSWQQCHTTGIMAGQAWVTEVRQRNYGHAANKRTWLYAVGPEPASLDWSEPAPTSAWISADRPRSELAARGIRQLGKREAKATPAEFRDLLISIAERCHQ